MTGERAIDIRELGSGDLEDCLSLDQQALDDFWTQEQWSRELADRDRLVLGAVLDQNTLVAVASAWLVLDELQIMVVAVTPAHQRQGIGSRLLNALLRLGQSRGAQTASLEVASTNLAAQKLYNRCGFANCGLRKGYYSNGDDALLQRRPISTG
ncbi:ribosomal protein S18-alanine N-acetyltransferase [Synechococcus sp. A15-60]|uniref:ribosomal protein S18-alanine N-acetyltransferase n=1 Tax=Synechococcus sp. A15-60 TaxID=1050655 RepID=UPI000C58B817|nr:ribosomal protein S18-alanine N-acetyltransferase [Synechococcus sp. A15-60]MAN20070.1 ribosomal-protein-alanine N-acetyltransferase [Synechococcus sp. EAC657]MEC7249211.1 ribosomal protein S18-alanine N-acetyltransferase [Cyanobacteriota bacterium]MEC7896421.1 ribosomal protein S18-alanine N-acetyltransferase [Cyanobacteriota bacterium]QNI48914.1 ribosomal-protein-alanine acetyltransferase [Synechococcus sp. A15-60]|tara:strand:- start:1231 stop:1692 length:462 start_codon:yes stop_codon:yes gene_type:complete